MEWTDEGIVLGVRRHGESSAIVELLTRSHGRHLGLVRGGAGSRMRPLLQPGNSVRAVWRARLDQALRSFFVQGGPLRAPPGLASAPAGHCGAPPGPPGPPLSRAAAPSGTSPLV